MLLGLISDTHGYFDPRLPEVFRGVERILHAGDIGDQIGRASCRERVLVTV